MGTNSYDAASNRTSYTAPDQSTNSYSYDNLDRPTGLTNSWAGAFSLGYDALGRRTSLGRPNGVTTSYSYDQLSHLLSVLHQAGGVTLDGATYTYDNAGNRVTKANAQFNTNEQYSYDAIYQLTQVLKNGTASESYSYDPVGNRLSSLGLSPLTSNASNQLLSTPNLGFTYDNNGNTLTKADGNGTTSYAWDFENRLTGVTLPGTSGTVSFKHDPFGRRIQKSSASGTTNYVYDGADIVAEYNAAGTLVARYDQGAGIDEPLAMSRGGALSRWSCFRPILLRRKARAG